MTDLTLYTAKVCPFAQRTRILLALKNLSYDTVEIDLSNKPADFASISPYGKVPVLRHGELSVYESSVINEYLEDVFKTPSFFGENAADRAVMRIWIALINDRFIPLFYRLLRAQDPAEQQQFRQELGELMQFINDECSNKIAAKQPFFFSDKPSLVDISLYPFFERLVVLEHYRQFSLPKTCQSLSHWFTEMAKLEAVQSTGNPASFYVEQYQHYAAGALSR